MGPLEEFLGGYRIVRSCAPGLRPEPTQAKVRMGNGRPLSERSVDHRLRVADIHREALARNQDYSNDVIVLVNGWDDAGIRLEPLHFDERGCLGSPPYGPYLGLVERICSRSGLVLPWLPESLKALTLDDIRGWAKDQLFQHVPGWTLEPRERRRRRRPASPVAVTADLTQGISFEQFASIDEERIRARMGLEHRAASESSFTVSPFDQFAGLDFKRVAIPFRQLGQRHHGLEDGYRECWKVFDWHRDSIPDTEIATRLWPELAQEDPGLIRHRVHQRLKTARILIANAYPETPVQPESRRKRSNMSLS
jgi:hypothetical protein